METLGRLGLDPEVQEVRANYGWIFGRFHNVVARVPGQGIGGSVLLVAHYDTSPTTRGAGDNGMAVAALLETLRALHEGPPLERDVVAVFSDGEEAGHLGMMGFLEALESTDDVSVAINFDASGTRGPVYLAETSEGNLELVRALAAATQHPQASSVATLLGQIEPLTSDFYELKAAGLQGFYFTHAGDPFVGHSMLDQVDHVDPRTLQHQGAYALSLSRHFASAQPLELSSRDAVFFSLLGRRLIWYSQGMAGLLAGLLVIATGLVVGVAVRTRRATPQGLAVGAGLLVLNALLLPLVTWLAWILLSTTEYYGQYLSGYAYWPGTRLLLSIALAVGLFGLTLRRASKKATDTDLLVGVLLPLTVLLAASAVGAMGATYLVAWPLLTLILVIVASFRLDQGAPSSLVARMISIVATLPAVVLMVPLIAVIPSLQTSTATPLVILLPLFLVLVLPALLPAIRTAPSALASLGGAGVLAASIALVVLMGFDAGHPRTNFLVYGLNADTDSALWAGAGSRLAVDEPVDPWLGSFLGSDSRIEPLRDFYAFLRKPEMRIASAPSFEMEGPSLTLSGERSDGDSRVLDLHLRAPPGTLSTVVFLESDIATVRVDGIEHTSVTSTPVFGYLGMPSAGVPVEVTVAAGSRVDLAVLAFHLGLPEFPGTANPSRPSDVMLEPTGGLWAFSDATIVRRTFTF